MSDTAPANVIRTYEDLRHTIDAHRREKGLTMLEMDAVTRLADGHSAKLICGTRGVFAH